MSEELAEVEAQPVKTPEQVVQELAEAVGRYPARKLADLQREFLLPPKEELQKSRDFWPGRISYYGERGAFTGGKVVKLHAGGGAFPMPDGQEEHYTDPVDGLNRFFEVNFKALLFDYKILDSGDIIFIYTSRLDEDEQAELQAQEQFVQEKMAAWHEARARDKLTAQTEKELALSKLLELAAEGQRYLEQVKPNLKTEKKAKKGKK